AKSTGLARSSASPHRFRKRFVFGAAIAGGLLLAMALKVGLWRPGRTDNLDLRSAPVQCSSFEPPHIAARAFDGVHRVITGDHYRWVSSPIQGDKSEWIAVDLGKDMRILRVTVDWELAFAKDFSVRTRTSAEQFVADPSQWTQRGLVAGFEEKNI